MGNRANCCFHLVGDGIDSGRVERFVEDLKAHLAEAVPYYELLEGTLVTDEYARIFFRVPEGYADRVVVPSTYFDSVILFTCENGSYQYSDKHVRCHLFFPLDAEIAVIRPEEFVKAIKKFATVLGAPVKTHEQLMSELNRPVFPVEYLECNEE